MPGPRLCMASPTTTAVVAPTRWISPTLGKVKKKQPKVDVFQSASNSARERVDYQHCFPALWLLSRPLHFGLIPHFFGSSLDHDLQRSFSSGLSGFLLWRLPSVMFFFSCELFHALPWFSRQSLVFFFSTVLQCVSDFAFVVWPFIYWFSVKCSGWKWATIFCPSRRADGG